MKKNLISIVVPCYNEEEAIPLYYEAMEKQMAKMDYVDFAYSKGLSPSRIRNSYIIRNVLVSTVTLLAMRMTYMLAGSIVIESVFVLPGLGQLLLNAILSRDYTVVQGTVFLFSIIVLVMNLITDISYSLLDPRVKLD